MPEGYIVHHLNGLRDDNRPENLVALSKKDHNKVDRLKLAEARIRQLEQESVARPEPWERD
ncbi:MAG: HNH endonuclease [Bacteroidetes bacterium]|nr:HNH endonuclease [Bacteroidota bacterium]